MKLTDLNPTWFDSAGTPKRLGVGMMFDCPCGKCGDRTHVNFNNPLDGGPAVAKFPPRWSREGDTFETLTLHPSVHRIGGRGWHGWLKNGEFKPV